ncbi:MAG: hypothetical protein KDB00_01425 [Planctomycetales bacterium]|nr:hypothetical protein [Planctomycetales bacterium]
MRFDLCANHARRVLAMTAEASQAGAAGGRDRATQSFQRPQRATGYSVASEWLVARRILCVVAIKFVMISVIGTLSAAEPSKPGSTVLGISDSRFIVNQQPTFLLGVSYYGALGASEDFIRRDLDDLQRHGFNWIRVWATWGAFDNDVSAVDSNGAARPPFLAKLQWLVAQCDQRGMVVDVTLTRGKSDGKSLSGGNLPDFDAHQRAVETIVNALTQHRNWYLDLANERDVRDQRFVSIEELEKLRQLVRRLDPQLLVTASFGGHDLTKRDARDSLIDAGHDFLSVHRPRHAKSPGQTEDRTVELLAIATELKHGAAVHHQEPFRRGYAGWEPNADDFLTDLRGAVAGGAAGWCFHNGSGRTTADNRPRRSFDLREKRLVDQLDSEELKVLAESRQVLIEAQDDEKTSQ